jgi:hypothetical protein
MACNRDIFTLHMASSENPSPSDHLAAPRGTGTDCTRSPRAQFVISFAVMSISYFQLRHSHAICFTAVPFFMSYNIQYVSQTSLYLRYMSCI